MSRWAELGKSVESYQWVLSCSVFILFAHTHTVPVRECMLVLYNDKVTAFICSTGGNVTQYTWEHLTPAKCRGRHSIALLGLEPGILCRCKIITLHSRRTVVTLRVMESRRITDSCRVVWWEGGASCWGVSLSFVSWMHCCAPHPLCRMNIGSPWKWHTRWCLDILNDIFVEKDMWLIVYCQGPTDT